MEFMDTLDKVPDHLKCPICTGLPKSKVFQCVNGHTVCEQCSSKLTTCPHCRTPFGSPRIRSLAIENMLDELKLKCQYTQSGCRAVLRRNLFQSHLESCGFKFAKNGPFINVCRKLGYKHCNYQMSHGNIKDSIQHFQVAHKAICYDSEYCQIELFDGDSTKVAPHRPIILDTREMGYAFLVLPKCYRNRILSWAPYFWQYPGSSFPSQDGSPCPYQVRCGLYGMNSLTWNVFPADILHVGDFPEDFTMSITPFMRERKKSGCKIMVEIEILEEDQVEEEESEYDEDELVNDDASEYEEEGESEYGELVHQEEDIEVDWYD